MVIAIITFDPIGIIKTPFHEKFGVPRQPLLIPEAKGEIHFAVPYANVQCLKGIEQFSHLWLLFVFNQTAQQGFKPQVRPPRLGGNEKLGVFATRSNFRPNPIGLSVVLFEDILIKNNRPILIVSGVDLINETPILDIKPYLPYCDAVEKASAGFAQHKPKNKLHVYFSPQAIEQLAEDKTLIALITKLIQQDPRPAYKQNQLQKQHYGMKIDRYNVEFTVMQQTALVQSISVIF